MNNPFEHKTKIFNSPSEYALRSLLLIQESGIKGIDLDRLVTYDYLILHSGDIPNGPESIHPAIPFRSAQILIKREIIKKGLNILISKELIIISYNKDGIRYKPSSLAPVFLSYLNTSYYRKLQKIISWVINEFSSYSDLSLQNFIDSNLTKWGSEFQNESLIRDKDDE